VRYNQPFGTPEPPLGTFPRYINGNPVTGTAGSIPPARAFDEVQIEILTVIMKAGADEGMAQTPSHDDLEQLWKALQILFAQRFITTHIFKSVHGPGADFPNLIDAMEWVARYVITPSGYVTFLVAGGQWTYVEPIEVNHANANRIAVQGAALKGASPLPPNISVTGFHSPTDGTNQIIYLRSVYATELIFTGGSSGFITYRDGVTLRYLLLTGSQTGNQVGIDAFGDVWVDGVAVWGMGHIGININSCQLLSQTSLSIVVCFCNNFGIVVTGGRVWDSGNQWWITCSNGICGWNTWGTLVHVWLVDCRGHNPPPTNRALHVNQGTQFVISGVGSQIDSNNVGGIFVAGASTLDMRGAYCRFNQGWGLQMDGGFCWADFATFQGNVEGSVYIRGGASCRVNGAVLNGGASGVISPPTLNEVGNNNSMIYT